MYNEYQEDYFQKCASDFEKLHPEIDVVIERVTGGSWTDMEVSLFNDFGNRTPPDISRVSDGFLPRLIDAGLLDEAPQEARRFLDEQPVSEDLKSLLRRGDKVYGVIHGATWQAFFYNKDHFREVGLDPDRPPRNWDELLEYARKLTRYDENGTVTRAGFSLRKSGYAPGTGMKFYDFFFSAGGELFTEDRQHCLLNSEAGVRALQFYLDCLYGDPPVDGYEVVGDTDGFVAGTVSMYFRDPWVIKFFADNAPDLDYGIASIIPDVRSASNGGIYPFVVSRDSREKELAWEFIMFLMEPESFSEYSRNEMNMPLIPGVQDMPEFKDIPYAVFLRQPNVKEFPFIPHSNEIQGLIGDTIERVCRNNEDPKAAFDQLVAQVDQLLQEKKGEELVAPNYVSAGVLAILVAFFLGSMVYWWKIDPDSRSAYMLLAPMIVYFAVFMVYPIVSSLILSFWDYNPLEAVQPFVGFDNFIKCFHDEVFIKALNNTLIYSFFTVALGGTLSLLLALVLNKALEAVGLYRTLYFIPVVTSIMGAVLIWKFLYMPNDIGLLNRVLMFLGMRQSLWLEDEKLALGCLVAMAIWKNLGFNMVIFLAGLKAIPDVYYEAAAIDGASGWRIFSRITLPALKPTILFVIVTSFISTFQVFTQVVGMTEGGPNNATRTIVYHIYEVGFSDFQLGYGSAAAVVMLVIVGFITWLQMRIVRE
jgi:ABC-type sugar transport system permease subunit/ABC-type glycerol-3-phosphate transport system substrate-binding protein